MKFSMIVFAGFSALLFGSPTIKAQGNAPFDVVPIGSRRVPVTLDKMTNIIFPVAIRAGIKVSREVAVQKVKGVDNVLELKALRRDFRVTNLAVFGMDGKLYCFDLQYCDSPAVSNFRVVDSFTNDGSLADPGGHPVMLTGLPADITSLGELADSIARLRGFLHNSVKVEKLRVRVTGIYLKQGLMWLAFRVKNNSSVDYRPEFIRLSVQDRRKVKRMAVQEIALDPTFCGAPKVIPGNTTRKFAIGYLPFTLSKSKQLVLSMAEENGGREVTLMLKSKSILRARAE